MAKRWAESQGLTLVEKYKDTAKTSQNMDRPSL